jgi:protease II
MNILIRTSENDSQVYAYESYKWLEALRGKNKNDTRKILYNSKDKGHFLNSYENFSQDFFLLNSFRI